LFFQGFAKNLTEHGYYINILTLANEGYFIAPWHSKGERI